MPGCVALRAVPVVEFVPQGVGCWDGLWEASVLGCRLLRENTGIAVGYASTESCTCATAVGLGAVGDMTRALDQAV